MSRPTESGSSHPAADDVVPAPIVSLPDKNQRLAALSETLSLLLRVGAKIAVLIGQSANTVKECIGLMPPGELATIGW
jgi:hypothetical protein